MSRLSSLMQAAVLLNALPRSQAAKIVARLDPADAKTVLDAVTRLDASSGDELQETVERFADATSQWQEIQTENSRVDAVQDRVQQALSAPRSSIEAARDDEPFDFLADVLPAIRCHVLQNEHPRNIALVLAAMPPQVASETMQGLDDNQLRASVLRRLCDLEDVDVSEVTDLAIVLRGRLRHLLKSSQSNSPGIGVAASLLSSADTISREVLLAHVGQMDVDLANKLKRRVFDIERLTTLNETEVRTVLKHVDTSSWAPALKNATLELKQHLLKCMAPAAAELLEREMQELIEVDRQLEELSRRNIIEMVQELARNGKIDLRKRSRKPDADSKPSQPITIDQLLTQPPADYPNNPSMS